MMNKYLLLYITFLYFILAAGYADEGKFLLLFGPSGVGKSTIINHLKGMDNRFIYVSPYTTRDLRPGETDKVHISLEAMMQLEREGKLLVINQIYGIYYATPKNVIDDGLSQGKFPILDWPVEKMGVMLKNYKGKLHNVYIEPENLNELERRLALDSRDKEGKRFAAAKEELEKYANGAYDNLIDMKVLNCLDKDKRVASEIYNGLLQEVMIQ